MLAARRSQFSRISDTNLNMICCRASTLVARHAGKAFSALSTGARELAVGHLRHARVEVVGGRVVQVDEVAGARAEERVVDKVGRVLDLLDLVVGGRVGARRGGEGRRWAGSAGAVAVYSVWPAVAEADGLGDAMPGS